MTATVNLRWTGETSFRPVGPAEVVGSAFEFTEGPIWDESGWVFSDIPQATMWALDRNGALSVFRENTNRTNGNTRDLHGRLISCEHSTSRVVREEDGVVATLVDSYEGVRLNSPNDVIVRGDGDILFTDPSYGRTAEMGELRPQDLTFQGVFRLSGSELTVISDTFVQPNGLCLSPDERILYVNDSYRCVIESFSADAAGGYERRGIFARPTSGSTGVPDGMKCDPWGNVWCTAAGGIRVYNLDGREIALLELPQLAANFAFGGVDGRSLLITAGSTVLLQPMNHPMTTHHRP